MAGDWIEEFDYMIDRIFEELARLVGEASYIELEDVECERNYCIVKARIESRDRELEGYAWFRVEFSGVRPAKIKLDNIVYKNVNW